MGVADLAVRTDDSSFLFVTCWAIVFEEEDKINAKQNTSMLTSMTGRKLGSDHLSHPKFTEQTRTGDCNVFRIFTYSDSQMTFPFGLCHWIIGCWSWQWCDFLVKNQCTCCGCQLYPEISYSMQHSVGQLWPLLGGVCTNFPPMLLYMLHIQWMKKGHMLRQFRLYKSSNADLVTEVFFICFILLTSFGLMCQPQWLQRNRPWFKDV